MRFESGSSVTRPGPIDVYLGFEIFLDDQGRYVAVPQEWAHEQLTPLKAEDLPALRKEIWFWWHNLHEK